MNHELLLILVVDGSSLHFDCVVSVAQLSEAEAAHMGEVVDFVHEGSVAVSV